MSQSRQSATLTKEEIEKLISKRADEKKNEIIAELQDRGIAASETRRIRRELQLSEVKVAGADDWFRSATKGAHHHWKTLMWTLLYFHKHEGTIDNSYKWAGDQKPKPYVKIAVVVGIFAIIALIIINQTEALGLGAWLQNNGYIVASVGVIIVAAYWIRTKRNQRREQEQSP